MIFSQVNYINDFSQISLEESRDDINVKKFLQIFIDDNIRKIKILQYVFNDQCENIKEYIDIPNKLDIDKFNKCTIFFNNYSKYLENNYGDLGYLHLCNVMIIIVEYFGGISEYNKLIKYFEKIHHKHIGQDLAKLHKIYPAYFPKFKRITTCFFNLFIRIEFRLNIEDSFFYRLYYTNKYWTFVIVNDTCDILVDTKSIEEVIKHIKLIF